MTPGARCLTTAAMAGVAVVGAPVQAAALPVATNTATNQAPRAPSSLRRAHATLDGLQTAVRIGKRDLVELKTRAAQLSVAISQTIATDAAHASRLLRERSLILDEVSTLQSVLPAMQGQRHALASAVHDAELAYLDCQAPPPLTRLSSVPQPEACSDHP